MTLPATFNGEEPSAHEEQQRLKQLHIEPGNWKGVNLANSAYRVKFVGIYLAPCYIFVDLTVSPCSLLPSFP